VTTPLRGTKAPLRRHRARRGQGDLLRGEILAAATALLAETGDEAAVSVRAVAGRVGVSVPSVYLHFADKQALLDAVCDEVFGALDRAMEEAANDATDPLSELERRGVAYVDFALQNPEHYRIVMMRRPSLTAAAHEFEQITASRAFDHLLAAVKRCVDAGYVEGEVLPVALYLWAVAHGTAALMIAKPALPFPADFVASSIRASVAGVLASPAPGDR